MTFEERLKITEESGEVLGAIAMGVPKTAVGLWKKKIPFSALKELFLIFIQVALLVSITIMVLAPFIFWLFTGGWMLTAIVIGIFVVHAAYGALS